MIITLDLRVLAFGGRLVGRIRRHLTIWHSRRQLRQALGRMDAHLLKDLGWHPEDAAHECAKPFWRV